MIAAWAAAAALADPVALRGVEAVPTAVVGLHDLSLAAPLPGSSLEVAASVRADRGAAGAALGRRWRLARGDRGWQADAGVSGGVVIPLVVPSVGLTATPWVSAGPVGERGFLQGVVAAPLAASLAGGVRLPVLAELQGGVHAGPITVGLRLGLGAAWVPGTDVSVLTDGALLLAFRG